MLTSTNSYRWAGRSDSQHQRRKDWVPSSAHPRPHKGGYITSYGDASHLLGYATRDNLSISSVQARAAGAVEVGGGAPRYELPAPQVPVELPTAEARLEQFFAAATCDWAAQDDGCLGLTRGETVVVTRTTSGGESRAMPRVERGRGLVLTSDFAGWWYGQSVSRSAKGWVPAWSLRPVSPPSAAPSSASTSSATLSRVDTTSGASAQTFELEGSSTWTSTSES